MKAHARRILVVDDRVEIHEDFAKILGRRSATNELSAVEEALFGTPTAVGQQFDLEFAHRGEDALVLVRRSVDAAQPFALAFVDIRMSGWDGVETVARLWEVDPRLQIVLCTAYSTYSWDDITTRLGVGTDFLILKKPFDVIEVRQLAHALTQKWLLLDEKAHRMERLEIEVARRTDELARANTQLQVEMVTRLRAEREHRNTQKLQALGRLASGVGHEINNPLTYIMGNLDFCRGKLGSLAAERDPGSLRDLLEAIDEARGGAERIRRVVYDIRQFSRSSEDAFGPVDVNEAIRSAGRLVAPSLRHRAALVEAFGEVPAAMGERGQLEQVLVNVLGNAVQALPVESGATNEIRARTGVDAAGDVVIEIEDNGAGIEEENLDRVFDPFFTTRKRGEGSGLGLSIGRGVVERFGGTIAIESQAGRGTLVRIVLPSAGAAAIEAPRPAATAARGGRILVVDDELPVLRTMQRMLAAYDVSGTTDGAEAVERYRRGGFDLLVCDLMMPRFSGMDVHAALAALGSDHARRIVFMTGGAFTPESTEFLSGLETPHLEKPFTPAQLCGFVETRLAALRCAPGTSPAQRGAIKSSR